MKKILITLLGLFALPASATFYTGDANNFGVLNSLGTVPDRYSLERPLNDDGKAKQRPTQQSNWAGSKGAGEQQAWDEFDGQNAKAAKKLRQKRARNTAYGKPSSDSSHGSNGSSSDDRSSSKNYSGSKLGSVGAGSKGSSSNGSKGASYGSKGGSKDSSHGSKSGSKGSSYGSKGENWGSKGSRGNHWLDKETKREQQIKAFSMLIAYKLNNLPGWEHEGDPKDSDKDFWSADDIELALLSWLSPHLGNGDKWGNEHWKSLQKKFAWWIKHIKGHYPHEKPEPPAAVPLPASVYLFGSALLGLGAIGRKRGHGSTPATVS